ncbi:unnamed protein product [Ixodes pacificus]
MAVLSILRAVGSRGPTLFRKPAANAGQLCAVRKMSEHMRIRPSNFAWNLFKDHLHFYFLLGVIPIGTFIFLVNVFIGPPQLADIPEGYEPKYWEYYNHPIKQWIARYIGHSPQENYEKMMYLLQVEYEKAQLRMVEKKVKDLMDERGDYQAWYYVPYDSKYTKFFKEKQEELDHSSKTV